MKNIANFLVILLVLAASCNKKNDDGGGGGTPPTPPPPPVAFAKGADISWLTEMESAGRRFYNAAGTETECISLLKSLGMNTVRLRVWVNPAPAWNDVNDVVAKAVRAKNLGMRIMVNFHYSDTWADPGNQTKPAAWAAMGVFELKSAIASHTTQVLVALKNAGVTPEFIQVGNETNDGMLWPNGKASAVGGMANYAQFINAGYDAAKAVFPAARVIVHLSNGWDNALYTWNIGGLMSYGARFDVIGLSLYPSATDWATKNAQCLANMNDLAARYNKEVMVVETGMPWDQAPACKAFLTDLMAKIKSVNGGRGLGLLYWEPQSYAGWKGYTLGAFDNSGKPTVALDPFAN